MLLNLAFSAFTFLLSHFCFRISAFAFLLLLRLPCSAAFPFGLRPDNCTSVIQYADLQLISLFPSSVGSFASACSSSLRFLLSLSASQLRPASASCLLRFLFFKRLNQALDRLVSTTFIRYRTSSVDLSPGSLPGVLLLPDGSLLLEVGFTLRCLQRLSRPYFASLLCRWHDNSCTSGMSIPVLSY